VLAPVDAPRSVIRSAWQVIPLRFLSTAVVGACLVLAALVEVYLANATSPAGAPSEVWARHRALITSLPDAPYHLDRFRAIRGRVTDEDGKPVAGALVRCVKVESLVGLADRGPPTLSNWKVPIETEMSTRADGTYEFGHRSVGARTLFCSAPGRELAPSFVVYAKNRNDLRRSAQ
jgi:hypothetical protein